MTPEPLAVHLILSIFIFFTINWLGKHSVSLGYVTLTAFVKSDDAPAFNLFFRVLSPVVLVILFASLFYSIGYDYYVQNIWIATLFYCVGRFLFILVFDRVHLVNWIREAFIWLSSTGLSWIIYEYFIKFKTNLLPQPEELKNEFWILLILFIYSVFNHIEFNGNASKKRKQIYCKKTYKNHKEKYHSIIKEESVDVLCESLIYAILLYENFNRPKLVRMIERVTFPHIAKSIGPMQVKTEVSLSDFDSVRQGAARVAASYLIALKIGQEKSALKETKFNPYMDSSHMRFLGYKVASDYNKDDSYVDGVTEMHEQLIENVYLTFKPLEIPYDRSDWYF